MGFLDTVTYANATVGQRIVISGMEGVGKTTLACGAPGALLVPMEQSNTTVRTAKLPHMLSSWTEVEAFMLEAIAAAKLGRFRFKTIVHDSGTALERLIHREVLARDSEVNRRKLGKMHSMETAHEGYGKAYVIANDMFNQWLNWNDQLAIFGGINIVVTCHVFVMRLSDPSAGEYDSFELLMHSPKNAKSYGKRELITQWADMVGFLRMPIIVSKAKDEKMARGMVQHQGQRVLELDRSPAWTAKNRYGLSGAIVVPEVQSWNYLADVIYKSRGIDLFNRELV